MTKYSLFAGLWAISPGISRRVAGRKGRGNLSNAINGAQSSRMHVKKLSALLMLVLGPLGIASNGYAVEYEKICSLYGAGFHYVPGTDICVNETGDTREETAGGVWRWSAPDSEGRWVTNPTSECAPGKLVKVGAFSPSDLSPNGYYGNYVANPFGLTLKSNEFISKVMVSGGFYDPNQPHTRAGAGADGKLTAFCLNSADPNFQLTTGGNLQPPSYWCNSQRPLACVSPSLLQGMQGTYTIPVTTAYPNVYYNTDSNGNAIGSQPVTCGSQLVVTTTPNWDPTMVNNAINQPVEAAGKLSVSVCVEHTSTSNQNSQ